MIVYRRMQLWGEKKETYYSIFLYLPSCQVVGAGVHFHFADFRFVFCYYAERSVYQVKVDIVQLQIVQRLLQTRLHVFGSMRERRELREVKMFFFNFRHRFNLNYCPGFAYLGDDEQFFSGHFARGDPFVQNLTDDVFVFVRAGRVDVSVTAFQGFVQGHFKNNVYGLQLWRTNENSVISIRIITINTRRAIYSKPRYYCVILRFI